MITEDDINQVIDKDGTLVLETGGVEDWLKENEIDEKAFVTLCLSLAEGMKMGMIKAKLMSMMEEEDEDENWIQMAVSASMGVAFMTGWSCHKRFGDKDEEPPINWPEDDVTAMGVLNTIADRRDLKASVVYQRARESALEEQFDEVLEDEYGNVESYFLALSVSESDEMLAYDYDKQIGPAVDRVEDWLYP